MQYGGSWRNNCKQGAATLAFLQKGPPLPGPCGNVNWLQQAPAQVLLCAQLHSFALPSNAIKG